MPEPADPLQTFVTRERAKQQEREEREGQRQERLDRRQRMADALRGLLDLLPLSGANAVGIPFSADFRQQVSGALLTAGEAMRVEEHASTVTALKAGPDAYGSALRLLQRAAAGDERGIAQDLAALAEISERAQQDVWEELRSVAEQLLTDWLEIQLTLQQAAAGDPRHAAGTDTDRPQAEAEYIKPPLKRTAQAVLT